MHLQWKAVWHYPCEALKLQQLFPPENEECSPKVVDKLAKAFTRDGKEEWILIHVEVQNRYHEGFGRRMLTYYYRILDKYNKLIAAYAILTEGKGIARPDIFKLEYLGTSLFIVSTAIRSPCKTIGNREPVTTRLQWWRLR